MSLLKCDGECGAIAVWYYMPASEKELKRAFCNNCVPRGCDCNYRYVSGNVLHLPDVERPFKWIEEGKIWCYVDEQGRPYPCCEYDYDEEGIDIET